MKIRISLLMACLAIVGIRQPVNAQIIKNAPAAQVSARAKNLEIIIRQSGLCKHYPVVIKVFNDNIASVATYGDRRLYEVQCQGLQNKVDAALAAWHEASRDRDVAYEQLTHAKEQY